MIDPTYLRIIFDGLDSHTLNKGNAPALPLGLIGIYEEALPPANQIVERQEYLHFFSVWSLLKKEVSVAFISPLLGWTEERVADFLILNSKWFNSPLSGKYILYHERFRSFILQKISIIHFTACNEAIIKLGHEALKQRNADEWEHYTLEHLSKHLLIQAMGTGSAEAFKNLAYNRTYWDRQLEISKGFEWSKDMLNDLLLWAAKYDDDEVIDSSLLKLELYHKEKNATNQIIELLTQNDIKSVINRIDTLGGNDWKGFKAKFKTILACLIKLTFSDSDSKHRQNHIKSIIEYFDDSFPVEQEVFNCTRYFSDYTMFQLSSIWAELGIDYSSFYKRSFHDYYDNEFHWIKSGGPYNQWQIEVLIYNQNSFNDIEDKSKYLKLVLGEIINQGELEIAIIELPKVTNDSDRGILLVLIAIEMYKLSNSTRFKTLLSDALTIFNNQKDEFQKIDDLLIVSQTLLNAGLTVEGIAILESLIPETQIIKHEGKKTLRMIKIANLFYQYADSKNCELILSTALISAEKINDFRYQAFVYWHLTNEYYLLGAKEKAYDLVKQAFNYSNKMNSGSERFKLLTEITASIFKLRPDSSHSKLLEGIFNLQTTLGQSSESNNIKSLWELYFNLKTQGNIISSEIIKNKVFEIIDNIKSEIQKISTFINIIRVSYTNQNHQEGQDLIEKVILLIQNIEGQNKEEVTDLILTELSDKIDRDTCYSLLLNSLNSSTQSNFQIDRLQTLNDLVLELSNKNRVTDAIQYMNESISYSKLNHEAWAYYIKDTLSSLCIRLASTDNSRVAFDYINQIDNETNLPYKTEVTIALSLELRKSNKSQDQLKLIDDLCTMIRGSKQSFKKLEATEMLARYYFQIGYHEIAKSQLLENLDLVLTNVTDRDLKDRLIKDIAIQLIKFGFTEDFLNCIDKIKSLYLQCETLMIPINDLYPLKSEVRNTFMTQVLVNIEKLGNDKDAIFVRIGEHHIKQGNFLAAIEIKNTVQSRLLKIKILLSISSAMFDAQLIKESESVLNEAIAQEKILNNEESKIHYNLYGSHRYENVFTTLLKQEKIEDAEIYFNENIDRFNRGESLTDIAISYFKKGNLELLQHYIKTIPEDFYRRKCWKRIAKQSYFNCGIAQSLEIMKKLNSEESKTYYFYGLLDVIDFKNINYTICVNLLKNSRINHPTVEFLINTYYLSDLFFNEIKIDKLDQIKKQLNINWAIDLKNSITPNSAPQPF